MQTLENQMPKVLFLNEKQEDTDFLTKDLPMRVIQTAQIDVARKEMEHDQVEGVFIDIASADPSDILDLRRKMGLKDVPIFILADPSELPLAIQYVKRGAQGFLVKGLSESDSVLKLMQYANSQH